MGTTAEKLEYLNATKTAIKDAIVAKGVDVADSTPFRQYAKKIEEIKGKQNTLESVATSKGGTALNLPSTYSPDAYSMFVVFAKDPSISGGTLQALAYFSDLDIFVSVGEGQRINEGQLNFVGDNWVVNTNIFGFGPPGNEWDFYAV